ncbi:MAG: sulfatase [Opitutae bacterium]|nr:sulfatase [Opitutae bacterium]
MNNDIESILTTKRDLGATQDFLNRRIFLRNGAAALSATALASLLPSLSAEAKPTESGLPDFAPKAKRVIYLFQSGAPSQMDLFDPKPMMEKERGKDLPGSIRKGQRLTTMTSGQKTFPIAPSIFKFGQRGQSGHWMSDVLPHLSKEADELCFIKSMHTEAINHDPAITFCQTGHQLAGRPSIGSWLSYGLGTENKDLPAYVVLTSWGTGRPNDQPLYDRLWGAGFLPTQHQGVKFRNSGDPVLYLSDPKGIDRKMRRGMLDEIKSLNQKDFAAVGDPEIDARISQYEMAFRMQTSVPDLTEVSKEPKHILDSYGPDVKKPGTYASNCLLARRMAERDVRCIQLFHMGWDHHGGLPNAVKGQCRDTDQPTAALIADLRQRGLLEDTLIVWGGEFGRTIYSQGKLTATNYGRDHHPRCFTIFLAGAGIKKGFSFGATDDYCYNITHDPVHVHDLNATIMHLLGVDHKKLVYKFQGRDYRLTDVHGHVVKPILA